LYAKTITIGNRIPQSFYVTTGIGESDITIHAGSYHLALKDAGIERCNIMTYSSILPGVAKQIEKPSEQVHGEVMETISAVCHAPKGCVATAAIIYGWLYDRKTNEKYGGLVCEYAGNPEEGFKSERHARESLEQSIHELYVNGFEEHYELRDITTISRSFVPEKRFGTALVALCFVDYLIPIA
jgi:arginine decarboxylase